MLSNRLDLTDRIAIEFGLSSGKTFKQIAEKLHKSPSSISREVKANREFISGSFFLGNDCRYARTCKKKNICGDNCGTLCVRCRNYDCRDGCISYKPYKCEKINYPPYVCNHCPYRRDCFKNRYMYSAKLAQARSDERRSVSRKGVRIDEQEIQILNCVVERGIKKGQPLAHIYEQHKNEFSVSLRSIYNYIDGGLLSVKNIDLRRKVAYKKRKKSNETSEKHLQQYRVGRGYDEFKKFMLDNSECPVVQMDTVKGKKEKGAVILTMLMLKYDIMLLFLLPENTASAVIDIFDFLTDILGVDGFQKLFPLILTDNGSEFKRVSELEFSCTGEQRCMMFYCDPMASWQKGELEKNHEYIRYVIPKGTKLDAYTQEDMQLLMNHINSVKRPGLHGRCPYETVPKDDDSMRGLMKLLKMDIIHADDVHLNPTLLKR